MVWDAAVWNHTRRRPMRCASAFSVGREVTRARTEAPDRRRPATELVDIGGHDSRTPRRLARSTTSAPSRSRRQHPPRAAARAPRARPSPPLRRQRPRRARSRRSAQRSGALAGSVKRAREMVLRGSERGKRRNRSRDPSHPTPDFSKDPTCRHRLGHASPPFISRLRMPFRQPGVRRIWPSDAARASAQEGSPRWRGIAGPGRSVSMARKRLCSSTNTTRG